MSDGQIHQRPGRPYPLGATWDGAGVNFALWSEHAEAVELCLFDAADPAREIRRIALSQRSDQVWHVFLAGAGPGLLYGYRVRGPYAPSEGHRFNPAKVLLDPYARSIAGRLTWSEAVFGYRPGEAETGQLPDERDDASSVPKSVVVDPAFDWEDDHPPRTPWADTIVYELHVMGFTAGHPDLPAGIRGTYAGLASPASLDYLTRLGVTAVELLPVHHSLTEKAVWERSRVNYWGYSSIGFFSPDARLAGSGDRGGQVAEFKSMVKALHRAGLEVILDVVYNHTAEGDHLGPTLCFRGIENAAYYRLSPDDRRQYVDCTGCGNTFNAMHPRAIQLVMDSLRYWLLEMRVDGFRFDLAPALARNGAGVDMCTPLLCAIAQDPVVSQAKLIAEPWDLCEGGYQLGNFPAGWAEWNAKYRDTARRYWRGDEGQAPELGYRLTGSSDLYALGGRGPAASVNFVTAHDGFTLADLVSYERKHNEANGERDCDGSDDNLSWNGGTEGPTDDAVITRLRERQMRNFLATLLLSQGTPMLCAGDEIARTQLGNNNAYCQDGPVSWLPWSLSAAAVQQLELTRRLIRLRRDNPVFRRRAFFQGRQIQPWGPKDLAWFRPDGKEMTDEEWANTFTRSLGMRLAGDAAEEVDGAGEPIAGATFLVLLNAHHDAIPFVLPPSEGDRWELVLDTRQWEGTTGGFAGGETYPLAERSLAVLQLRPLLAPPSIPGRLSE